MNTWLIKVNTDGDMLWQKTIVRENGNWTFGICSYNGDGYLLSGIDSQDAVLTVTDKDGNMETTKIFGGDKIDIGCTAVSCKDGFAAVGFSQSYAFTEGVSSGRESGYQSTFISYFHSAPLGVAEPAKVAYLTIFPNPSNGRVSVIPASSHGTIYIVNAAGDVVYRQQVYSGSQVDTLNASGLAAGSYLVRWMGADGDVANSKLMVLQ